MDDRKLNEKLAKLCEIPRRTCEETYGPSRLPCTEPFLYGDILLSPNPTCDGHRLHERWDPVNRIEQVWDFVIQALRRMDLAVYVNFTEDRHFVRVRPFDWSWQAFAATQENVIPPRLICKVALEAFEKLEETT